MYLAVDFVTILNNIITGSNNITFIKVKQKADRYEKNIYGQRFD